MPLSKQPLEVSLGGAVEEGNVKELVQPPRIREAKDCASIKGGAYTKRDQLLTPGSVDDSTVGAAHVNDGLVTVAPTTVRVYPDDDNSEPSESNPAPFTELEVSAFEPTEADAVKEHGDSATLIIDGVPRTMCMWNVDPAGAYTWDGLGDNVNPRTAPLASSSGAAYPQNTWRDEWWTYLPVGGVRYAVFDADKQVGAEQTLPVPSLVGVGLPGTLHDYRTQAEGPPCFPRVRAFEYEYDGDTVRGFVSCAALSTPQIVEERSDGTDPPTGVWDYRTEGARLSTRTELGGAGGGTNPIASRDIMARNFNYAVFPPAVQNYPDYVQPGFVITRHDENGAIQETLRGTLGMGQGAFLRLPGPALDMVAVPGNGGTDVYTLHVDYHMTDRDDLSGLPPYRPNTTYQNEIRIIHWHLGDAAGLVFTNELRFNEQGVTGGGNPQIINAVPDIPGRTYSGLYDWPAGLHDRGNGLVLVMSSTQYALLTYTLGGLPPAVWKPPFWAPGDLTRLKIGRQRGLPQAECIQPEANNWINRGDAFERRTTYSVDPVDPPPPHPLWSQTTQMARGAWAGSFLTQPDEDGNRWLGVQAISDQWNVAAAGAPGDLQEPEGGHPYRRIFAPQAVSGSILHTLVNADLDSLGFNEVAGCIPGSVIASQGVFVPGIGHCVSIHASAAGDDRTGSQEIGDLTLGDVPSPTNFIVTRRDLPLPSNGESRRERPWGRLPTGSASIVVPAEYSVRESYPVNSPYVTAVAIVQALPYGQAMGTYMNNPYQLRVNLRLDADRVLRWTAHQRYSPAEAFGSGSLQQPQNDNPGILKPTGSSSSSAPYELSMSLQRQLPQLVSHGSYVTTAGAAPMVTGGPQGFLAGIALQAIADTLTGEPRGEGIDQPGYYISTDAFTTGDITNPYPTPEDPPVPIPDALIVASYLAVYDELGGEHRTLPVYLNRGYAYDEPTDEEVTEKNVTRLMAILYAVPWQIAGISLSETGTVNFFQGNESQEGIPTSVAVAHLPFVSHENYLLAGPSFPSSSPESLGIPVPPAPVSDFNPIHPFDWVAQSYPGSGAACYTWSGELGADAPDPSRAVGTAGNRLWSVSSVDPRKVQYTKTLRKGYAPEWNQQLFVRVPDTAQELTAVAGLPDGRILLFSPTTIHYTYGSGPSDTGQGSGFAEPAALSTDLGCRERLSVVSGDFGCMFRSDRGFYLVDRKLTLTYVGLPYEDSTSVNTRVMGTAIDSLRSEVLFFTDDSVSDGTARTWVFNTLRGQWSTFVMAEALTVTERNGRPFWIEAGPNRLRAYPSEEPATIEASGLGGSMVITTGWLPMAKVQGYGRTWELQITGERPLTPAGYSQSGLKVELLYDYDETPAETYFFNQPAEAGGANIKLRLRPRKQKSEALSVRFSEYAPSGIPPEDPFTGWRLDMLTVLVGIKVGLDKVPTTPRDNT